MPQDPPHWLFGNLHDILQVGPSSINHLTYDWLSRHQFLMKIFLSPFFVSVVIGNPEDAACILRNDSPKAPPYERIQAWLGYSLLTSSGDAWKRKRRLLTPAFNFDILKTYLSVFQDNTDVLLDNWDEKMREESEIDLCDSMRFLTLDIIGYCAFGFQINSLKGKNKDYVDAIHGLSQIFYTRELRPYMWPDFLFQFTKEYKKWKHNLDIVHSLPSSVIKKRRKELEEGKKITIMTERGKVLQDFLGILLTENEKDGNDRMSDEELRAEVDTFMFEGHDTTAHGLIWMIYCIARYRDVEEKVIEEIDRVLGDKMYPDFDDLTKLEYTDMVLKEVLRLYHPVPVVGRLLDVDTKLKDYTIPKGTYVQIPFHVIHRHPDHWENAWKFIPERWEKNDETKRHPFSFLPFSGGPRNCIGKKFAQVEELTIIAMIYKKFIPRLVNDVDVGGISEIIYRPAENIKIKLIRR